jgi:hypothetical protein
MASLGWKGLRIHETIPKFLHASSWCGISSSTRVTVPQLTPWSRVILEHLAGFRQVKEFPTLYGNWRFMTTFTRAQYLYLVTHYVISTHRMQDDQSFYRSVSRRTQLFVSFHVFFWSLPVMFWGQVRSLIHSSQNTTCYFSNYVRTTHNNFFKVKRIAHLSSLKGSFSYIY